ncbi:LysR family transcriptional regulator [Bradyrhizobium sp. SZCCHNS3002]|uniref:LysR family transcriptional regulator n=1 Tax=Bradyrhizobium sp. SZCCHNS3002 TaxID=3057310 RepID=UPI0028E8D629|nr:LysR family transcriptional regulator [Bradyrhizobium sp. SZCCHNS3002]
MSALLDHHRLHYLHEAIRLGSVRAAAEALDVNASVISRQIALLEKELGLTLLERLSRGIRATEAGALLVERFRQWQADQADTVAKLRELQGLKRGHVDIVLGEGFVSDLMSGPLSRFWQRHPDLTMSFDLAGTNEVVNAVAEDRHHIGMVFNPSADPRIRIATASRQPLCAIMPPDHALARLGRPLRLRELADHPLGLMHASYGTRQVVAMAEAAERVALSPKLTTSSINVLRHFVKGGLGLTLLPAFAIAADLADGSLAAVPVDNRLLSSSEACVITRRGRELPHAASHLLRFLSGQMRAFRVGGAAGNTRTRGAGR